MKSLSLHARLPVALRAATLVRPAADLGLQVRLLADLVARATIIVLFSLMAVRFAAAFAETGRLTGLLLLVSESIVVVLTVARRSAAVVDRTPRARALTTVSMIGPPLLAPAGMAAMAPEWATVGLSCVGLTIVIAGKVTLGRSFALLPANRGVVSSGVYRAVRHPIYLGYLVSHIAFLAASPSLWNVAMLATADAALLMRAVCEEETLSKDDAYREYRTRVRWRVAPGIF